MKRFKIKESINKIDLWTLIGLIPFIFALHEFEEWNILSWHRKYQSNIPEVTDLHLQIIFVFLIAIIFLTFLILKRFKNRKTSAYIFFPILSLLIYNGVVHLFWSIYFSSYSPGLIFGFIISCPYIGYIVYRMISERLISKFYFSVWLIVFIILFINTIINSDKLEAGILYAMLLGKLFADCLF